MTTTDSPFQHQAQDAEGLRAAAQALLNACVEDMGYGDEAGDYPDRDDEPVGHSSKGPLAVQFGHMRRLRDALAASPPQAETPGLEPVAQDKYTLGRHLRQIVADASTWEDAAVAFSAILAATAVSQPPTSRQGEAASFTADWKEFPENPLRLPVKWHEADGQFWVASMASPWFCLCGETLDAAVGRAVEALVFFYSSRLRELSPTSRQGAGEVEALRSDPVAVHVNMLAGKIAKPSIESIVHIYGADALRAVLPAQPGPAPVGEGGAIEAARSTLNEVKAWIDSDLPAGTPRAGAIHALVYKTRGALDSIPAVGGTGWQPVETAPANLEVRVKLGEMTFLAVLKPGAAEDENGSCDQWQAAREGEHPPRWSEGACWSSNVNESPSMPVEGWQWHSR